MDLSFSPQEYAFRDEIRAFIKTELPPDIRTKMEVGAELTKDEYIAWQKKLNARGWLAPNWPEAYGGTGWTTVQKTHLRRRDGPRWRAAPDPVRRFHGGAGHHRVRQRRAEKALSTAHSQ